MKSPAFNAIVKCKDIYEYYVTKGSLTLYVDPLYKQGSRKVTVGTVHCPPLAMPVDDNRFNHISIKAGDKVYFHYNALDESSLIPQTEGLFLIPLDMIFGYVRDGQLTAMDGKVFCRPYFDPDVVEITSGVGSKMRVRQTESGIISEINIKHDLKRAVVAHIGPPLKGFPVVDVKAGDEVYYAIDADFENTIEGETYFVMDQDMLLAKEA